MQKVTRGNHRARLNAVLLVSCCLLISLTLIAKSYGQGPGLYKDGKKIMSLDQGITHFPEGFDSSSLSLSSKSRILLDQSLGGTAPTGNEEATKYVELVLECRQLVTETTEKTIPDSLLARQIDAMLDLEKSLEEANQILLQKFELIGSSLVENGYSADKVSRHEQMTQSHSVSASRLLGLLAELRTATSAADQAAVTRLLEELRQYFIDNKFRQDPPPSNVQPRPILMETKEAPRIESGSGPMPAAVSYPSEANFHRDPNSGELDPTIDVQFTDEIIALADSLHHSPVEMYNFVRDNFKFEPYLGSRKGSQQTLDHRKGNDYDQASLLIALFRVSGIPARYATGTIEMPIDQAKNWLGIDDPVNAGSILTTAGMEGVLVYMNSVPVAIRCKRVWVEAWVPYINYRGAVNDSTGFMWVTLDPTYKQYSYENGINLPAEIGFNAESFVEQYYSTLHQLTPVDMFRQMLLDSLAVRYPGATYEDLVTERSVIRESDGFLPGTLPYKLLSFDGVYSEIPSSKRYYVRFHLWGSGIDLDYTTSLPEVARKQVTISYVGATAADQYIIDTAGGIFEVDLPYLVDLKPVLKIDGCEVARASGSVMMGETHYSDLHFTAPTGASNQMPTVSNTITAGNYQGIGLDTEDALPSTYGEPQSSCEENRLGQEQHQLALTYLNAVDRSGDDVGDLMHQVVINDVSEAIVENSVSVYFSGGLPVTMNWTGMIVDADRKIIGPFSVDGSDNSCDYMRLEGADGSVQEHRLFELRFDEEAISTIKILSLANDSGIPVCEITSSIAANCPAFNHPQSVRDAVNAALAQGHHVIIPQRQFTYYEWTGTGYIDIDPATCAAGYIIAGGQNGGATVQVWLIPWYLWFSNILCEKAHTPVTVEPASTNDMYCANSWDFWTFKVPQIDYYSKDKNGQCFIKHSAPRDFHVWYPIQVIAWIWGAGEYVFTAGGPGECAGCDGVEKRVTIVEVDFPSGDFAICTGGDRTMTVTVTPTSASAAIAFNSADAAIATVSGTAPDITIQGVAPGHTSLRALLNGNECNSKGLTVAQPLLTKVGKTVIEAGNKYSENTVVRVTLVSGFESGLRARFREETTSYYDGQNGATDLTNDKTRIVAIAGTSAELTIKSISNSDLEAGPPDANIVVDLLDASGAAICTSDPLPVDQWVDEDGDGMVDWLRVQSEAILNRFKSLSGITGEVAKTVSGVSQSTGDCGSTSFGGPATIRISTTCGTPNRHRLNVSNELSGTVIHEARHVWQASMRNRALGTDDDSNPLTPRNDDDRDWLPEATPASSEASDIEDGTAGSGDSVFDAFDPTVRDAVESDAYGFEAAHKND